METATMGAAPAENHAHHWKIAEAGGPLSEGVCKTCGMHKPFRNWLPGMDFITNEEHRLAAA